MGNCGRCGGDIIGDGYTAAMHCENAHDEDYEFNEPDADTTLCRPPIARKPFRSLGRDLFFDTVNAAPRTGRCRCGREYLQQWFRDGVEAVFLGGVDE